MTHTASSATGEQIVCRTEKVVFKRSAIHGTGGFAVVDLRAGEPIIQYVGEKIDKAESLRRCENDNEYIFDLNETHDLDGNVEWNPARFINHSCAPNCESEVDETKGEVWIQASRDIRAGEELTFNYCYDLEDYQDHPCRCGARECVGYMVAESYFEQIRRQRKLTAAAGA
ncbi:MAG TPA: SET domain-containing protein-lysine N-methyltransferase [Verrucomicrobiota bacterium]|nr:SET domain-containing protein-lysine N-methyltransferase [Verrucomicrobiota bacterium]